VAQGGIFAWHDVRENPDTFQCISTFHENHVLYTYATTFGSGYGDHTIIRATRGRLYSPGGEGSPQWWFLPETKSEWRTQQVVDLKSGSVKTQLVTVDGRTERAPRGRGATRGARATDRAGRRSGRAHQQLARMHPESQGPERPHRHRVRAR